MKYINGKEILPDYLITELQKYIQGGYIYIPTDENNKANWGESTGYRIELKKRNSKIVNEYKQGMSISLLAEKYSLSVHAIRKIIYKR